MEEWYDKYLSIYGKPFSEVCYNILNRIKNRLANLQSDEPLVSIVVIAYNEECRLISCLLSLSEMCSGYPIEILGVNNNSKDRTEDVFKSLGLPCYNDLREPLVFTRQCVLNHAKFCIDADTCYPPQYVNLVIKKCQEKDVACVSSFRSFFQ